MGKEIGKGAFPYYLTLSEDVHDMYLIKKLVKGLFPTTRHFYDSLVPNMLKRFRTRI
jgi:hypothetical protein